MIWVMERMHELFRVREVLRICAFWDTVRRILKSPFQYALYVHKSQPGATIIKKGAYPNRHNTLHLLEPQKPPPRLLHIHTKRIPDILPQCAIINPIGVKLHRLRFPIVGCALKDAQEKRHLALSRFFAGERVASVPGSFAAAV